MRRSSGIWTGLICVVAASLAVAAPKSASKKAPASQPAAETSWNKVKSSSGAVKTRATLVKFKVGSPVWRLRLTTSAAENAPASSATARIALMVETVRDVDGNPTNWQQVDVLTEGKAGHDVTREYDDGLDNNGEPKWFALSVLGYSAKYELQVEDQSGGKKKERKKKD